MVADANDQANDNVLISSTGNVILLGRERARGFITSDPDEALPGGTDLTISDDNAYYLTNELAGAYLMMLGGEAHTRVWTILSNTATTITLDQTPDAHGEGADAPYTERPNVSTVTCSDPGAGLTTVTADASPDALWDDVPAGGRCNAASATRGECFIGQDIEIGGNRHHIIDFIEVGGAGNTQDQFLVRGDTTCTTAAYTLRHWNANSTEVPGWVPSGQPNATQRVRFFPHSGDQYIIYSQATLTIPTWNRSDTDAARNTAVEMQAGGTFIGRYFEYGYGGNGSGNGMIRMCPATCTSGGADNAVAGEGVFLDYGELHHGGATINLDMRGWKNAKSHHIWERDSLQEPGSGIGHGLSFGAVQTAGGNNTQNVTISRWRFSRLGDEPATVADTTNNIYPSNLVIEDSVFEQIPWTPDGNSAGGFEVQCGLDVTLRRNVFAHAFSNAITVSNSDTGGICADGVVAVDNAFLGVGYEGAFAVNNGPTPQNTRNLVFANNYVEGTRQSIAKASLVANNFMLNFAQAHSDQSGTSLGAVQSSENVRGNILVGLDTGTAATSTVRGVSWGGFYTTASTRPITAHLLTDNAIFVNNLLNGTSQVITGSSASAFEAGDTLTIAHNYFESLNYGEATPTGTQLLLDMGDVAMTVTATDNVFAGSQIALGRNSAATSLTFTLTHNVTGSRTNTRDSDAACTNCLDSDGNEQTTPLETYRNFRRFDASLDKGMRFAALAASDGSVRGPRVAGVIIDRIPVPEYLKKRGYKYLINNTATAQVDQDGDGIFDLFDNCVPRMNPTQADTDGDEIGDACE
jgi:hypothetical protein